MTNTELAELFLLRLYDLAESEGHGRFVVLNDIAAEFGVTDVMKIHQLARALENRGLLRRSGSVSPTARAHITAEGALFVEAGGETGVMRDYREAPQKYSVSIDQSTHFHGAISDSHINVAPSISGSALPPEVVTLLDKMLTTVQVDAFLSAEEKEDLSEDISSLKAELQKPRPRRPIAEALLSTLGDISSLTSFAMQLQPYLPALLGG